MTEKLTKILETLANEATWCLPTVQGAVPIDREKLTEKINEAQKEIEELYDTSTLHEFKVKSYMKDKTGYYLTLQSEQEHTVFAKTTSEARTKVFAIRNNDKTPRNYALYAQVISSKEIIK